MLAPLSWLEEYVDIDITPDQLEEKLFSCGFEVEEKYQVGRDISKVVVGLVKECEPIPETHLSLCKVDAGTGELLQVCCGADNVKAGKKFPIALVGATVIKTAKDHKTVEGVMTIGQGKLRGYDSFGMLCSGIELGLNDDLYPGAEYNGLLELPDDAEIGQDIKEITGLNDWIFDIAITANRPDCQSILGIAREVAAVLSKEVKEPALDYTTHPTDKKLEVSVEAQDICPRYVAHRVEKVQIGEAPAWMRRRLALVGIRSISNIVDITNYILKELGQPMHAFDGNYIRGNQILVRRAGKGEKITTLDEKEFELDERNLVICDGEGPVALAGIMGGLNSEIQDTTTEVVFEAAKFARDNIRKSSRQLGQSSDSSQVFAKGVQEYTTVMAMERALHLIEELGCGEVTDVHCDVNSGNSIEAAPLTVSVKKINGLLGISVPAEEMIRILSDLNFKPELSGDELKVLVPRYREDVFGYQDIAEEIIRMYGYDKLNATLLKEGSITVGGNTERAKVESKIKRALCACGAYEGISYSFFSPNDLDLLRFPEEAPERFAIRILNPINEELSLMRTTIVPNLLRGFSKIQKKNVPEGWIFEIGNVFIPKELPLKEYPEERRTICIGIYSEQEDFYTLKGLVDTVAKVLHIQFDYQAGEKSYLHPCRTADIYYGDRKVGFMGQIRYEVQDELDMRLPVYVAEIDLAALYDCYGNKATYIPIPKYDLVKRDLALVVGKDLPNSRIEKCIRKACPCVNYIELFDVYQGEQVGENEKSMAYSICFVPEDKPFDEKDINSMVDDILKALKEECNAELRS